MPASTEVVHLRELQQLEAQRPELGPWLGPLSIAMTELNAAPWRSLSPRLSPAAPEVPLLHNACVALDASAARAHVAAVVSNALRTDIAHDRISATLLLEAAVANDDAVIASLAHTAGLNKAAFASAAQIAAYTLLQSLAAAIDPALLRTWNQTYCPICGAFPVLGEVLGIERQRRLRCGRCGAGWSTNVLLCVYCGERDHNRLGSLVPDGRDGQLAWVETCESCKGYLKLRAALRPSPAQTVLIQDARSIELDFAASERAYKRPDGPGFAVRLRIEST